VEKYVFIGFVLAGLLVWVTLAGMFSAGFELINPDWDRALLGAQFRVSGALGMAAGVAVTVVLWMNLQVNQLGLEIASELRNVTWPTWPETRVATIVVVVTTIVVSIILGVFDAVLGGLSAFVYKL